MNRHTDRQLRAAACRWGMAATWVIAGVLVARTAQAQVEVDIVLDPVVAAAPALFTVTASTSPADPVVDVRWLGLQSAPACSAISCSLQLNVAHCQRVLVEVTTLSGETGQAERTVCATDEGVSPPELAFVSDQSVRISGDIAWRRMWLDGTEVAFDDPSQWIPEADEGCHVLDAWVADSAGRSASAQRVVCLSGEAAQLSLLVDPAPQSTLDEIQFCGKVQHPLGRSVETVTGPDVDGRCGGPMALPSRLTPVHWVVEDTAGLRSQTTAIVARSPSDSPFTLLFLTAPGQLDLPLDDVAIVDLAALGGPAPYEVEVRLNDEPDAWLKKTATSSAIDMLVDFSGIPAGEHTLSWLLTDSRGMSASASTQVRLGASSIDGGVSDGGVTDTGPMPAAQGLGAGCASRIVEPISPLFGFPWWALLFLAALRRRRR